VVSKFTLKNGEIASKVLSRSLLAMTGRF